MADYITLEIQEEIIKKLPVRSLVRCRSVSKAWPKFIAAYSSCQTQPQHLLIRYGFTIGVEDQNICFVDDDTFPQQKFAPTVPLSIKQLQYSRIVGSSGGLLCLCGYYPPPGKRMAVLWNPSIRKSVAIHVPKFDKSSENAHNVLGFGVCPVNSDPKILKIAHSYIFNNSMPLKTEVYTLSTGKWRTVPCNLPRQSIRVEWNQVLIDRFIYWLALEMNNDGFRRLHKILLFDMITDEFREVYLPDSLAHQTCLQMTLSISKVRESLVVLHYSKDADKRICAVWMMEYGVPNTFTKLFMIKTPYASITTLRFTKSGKPIMKTQDDDYYVNPHTEAALVVYEPYSEHTNDLGISGRGASFSVDSYMETLLLLNQ